MFGLRSPQSLLQPWKNLTQFSEELYAMFAQSQATQAADAAPASGDKKETAPSQPLRRSQQDSALPQNATPRARPVPTAQERRQEIAAAAATEPIRTPLPALVAPEPASTVKAAAISPASPAAPQRREATPSTPFAWVEPEPSPRATLATSEERAPRMAQAATPEQSRPYVAAAEPGGARVAVQEQEVASRASRSLAQQDDSLLQASRVHQAPIVEQSRPYVAAAEPEVRQSIARESEPASRAPMPPATPDSPAPQPSRGYRAAEPVPPLPPRVVYPMTEMPTPDPPEFHGHKPKPAEIFDWDGVRPPGGGGSNVFIGKVVDKISDDTYHVTLYSAGPTHDPDDNPVVVTIPLIDKDEEIEADTWLYSIFQFSDDQGEPIYYCQPPVWLA